MTNVYDQLGTYQSAIDSTIRRPIVHMFVGLHKTGTTSIRMMLDIHRELFARHGFHIPRATWTAYINSYWNGGHNNIPREICGNHPTIPKYGTVADLVREIEGLPNRQHILLSEDLDVAQPGHIRRLKEAFASFDVRVVVFIRNQVDWMQSIYAEEQKWFGATTFAEWYHAHIIRDDRLNLHSFCKRWANAFGTVTIRCYEQIRIRVFDAFLECCGVPECLRSELAGRGLPLVNSSPGEFPLSLIRFTSKFATGDGVKPHYFNTMIAPAAIQASRILRRFSKKQAVIIPEVSNDLFPLMRTSNRELSDTFGVVLGPEYLDPVVPEQECACAFPALSMEELANIMEKTWCRMGVVVASKLRMLSSLSAESGNQELSNVLRQLAQSYYPLLPSASALSSLLDELIESALSGNGTALYLERNDATGTAYRQVAGSMVTIRNVSAQEWSDLILSIRFRAGFGPGLSEGYIELQRDGQPLFLRTRHVLTSNGELAILELCQHSDALELFKDALRCESSFDASCYDAACAAFNAGQLDDAWDLSERSIALRPGWAAPFHIRALIARKRGVGAYAVWELFKDALRYESSSAEFYYDAACAAFDAGQLDEAWSLSERSITLRPNWAPPIHIRGLTTRKRGASTAEVWKILSEALRFGPVSPELSFDAGLAAMELGKLDQALELAEWAAKAAPNWYEAQTLVENVRCKFNNL